MHKLILATSCLLGFSSAALARCPVEYPYYHGSESGHVVRLENRSIYNLDAFTLQAGQMPLEGVPIPSLSIHAGPASEKDLENITEHDWIKIKNYIEKFRERYLATAVFSGNQSYDDGERLSWKELDKVIACWLNQSAGTKKNIAAESASKIKDQPVRPEGDDSNALVYGELQVAGREGRQLYRDGLLEQMVTKKQGVKFDTRAPVISPGCISFENWGTGVAHDVKQIKSTCTIPVAVTHCFYDIRTPQKCKENKSVGWGTTNVIKPGGTALVVAGTETKGSRLKVDYYVCDMRNEDKFFCIKP
ncbi:hypothetical protein [Pseudomonas japonica]|nr:hypothetical protein [Pseudomonas japonica]